MFNIKKLLQAINRMKVPTKKFKETQKFKELSLRLGKDSCILKIETECPNGCCGATNWYCCPDGRYCAPKYDWCPPSKSNSSKVVIGSGT